jgi:nucleoid-associated protein YgaU
MSNYGFWLSYNNQQEGFQLPVNPGSIEISDGVNGRSYDVAGLGEINVIKSPKLTEYSFSSFFPAAPSPFVTAPILLDPQLYIDYIESWMASKRPIRFVFTGPSFDLNVAASIEEFRWKEAAGSGGDIDYTLRLKRYVFYAAQRVTVASRVVNGIMSEVIQPEPQTRPNDRLPPSTYTIVSGDSLWAIAKRFFDDGSRWRELQQLNGLTDAQIKALPIGYELRLPETGGTMNA